MQVLPAHPEVDILVTAAQSNPLLVVEVKRRKFDGAARDQVSSYSRAVGADFVMAVDLRQILIAPTQGGSPDWERAVTLPTDSILRHYTDVSEVDKIEGFYLESLIESWLRDFSFSWKHERPPGYDELERIGLASRLRNSETHAQTKL
jgi:hypothetical protein